MTTLQRAECVSVRVCVCVCVCVCVETRVCWFCFMSGGLGWVCVHTGWTVSTGICESSLSEFCVSTKLGVYLSVHEDIETETRF